MTKTHALLTGSRAINAGLTVLISQDLADIDGDGNRSEAVPFEQRGNGYTRVTGSRVDIGAFEVQSNPSLSIGNMIITEGDSGTKNAVFTVTRAGTATQSISVNYATANGSATAGSDYVAKTGTLTFATNETTKTISIVINGDTVSEFDETFLVNLSNATNATIFNSQGFGTITNDDAVLTGSPISLYVNTFFDENDGSASTGAGLSLRDAIIIANNNPTNDYIINLAGGQTYFLTVGSSDEDNGLGGDLDVVDGANVTIRTNGASPATINATTLLGDGDRVLDVLSGGALTLEKVVVTGGRNTFGTGIYNSGTLNVFQTTISNNSNNSYGGGIYNGGDLTIAHSTISDNIASYGGGIINYGTTTIANSTISGNSANFQGGGIYNGSSNGVLLINSTITNNLADADNNSSSGDGGGIYNSSGNVALRNTIIAGNFDTPNNTSSKTKNPDIRGSVQGNGYNLIGNLTGASGTIGTGSDIVLTSGQTAGLGALANNGGVTKTHALLSGSRAINAGLTVLISQDFADIDGDGNRSEAVPRDQRGGNFARISGSSVDIGAFEFQPTTTLPTLRINDRTIVEGNSGTKNMVFTVTRTGTALQPITLNYATANGTTNPATAGSDYVAKTGSLSFATNETSKTISVVINGDTTIEPNETFFVNLSGATNATIADNQGRGTITNDDFPSLAINDRTIVEGNSGTKNMVFTVTRTGTALQPITVNYATANGTATAGSDYVAKSGSLSFATNETSKTISIVINGDTTVEPNETFFVNLSNATNATISDNQGLGTITNDDSSNLLLVGDANNNNLVGGAGNDTLQGLGGNDTLRGGAGNDRIEGGTGADSMVGGTGNDTYFVDSTLDRVIENANEGTDTVSSSISYLLGSNLENLTLTGTSNLTGIGNALNNRITGNSGANIINGNDGNDTLLGGGGNDNLNGGNGNDRIDGGTGNDKLMGSNGNDVLLGGDGNDTLIGGNGADTLTGGIGVDRFVFKYADEGIDRITDFSVTQGDKIVVSASGFDGGLTANANLTSSQFRLGSSASNASQRFIYNSSNGALLFDQDGNGIIPSLQIGTLSTGLALTNTSIFVES